MKRFSRIASRAILLSIFCVAGWAVVAIAKPEAGFLTGWYGAGSRNNTYQFKLTSGSSVGAANLVPGTDNTNSIGTASLRVKDFQGMTATFGSTITVRGISMGAGNLVVGTASKFVETPGSVFTVKYATKTYTPTSTFQLIGSTGAITLVGTPIFSTTTATPGQRLVLLSTAATVTLQLTTNPSAKQTLVYGQTSTLVITTSTAKELIFRPTTGSLKAAWHEVQ